MIDRTTANKVFNGAMSYVSIEPKIMARVPYKEIAVLFGGVGDVELNKDTTIRYELEDERGGALCDVTGLETKTVDSLTVEEAEKAGFGSLENLKDAIKAAAEKKGYEVCPHLTEVTLVTQKIRTTDFRLGPDDNTNRYVDKDILVI